MDQYETIIHVVTEGADRFEAGEKAGGLLDLRKIFADAIISCEPTRAILYKRKNALAVKKYETTIRIVTEGLDEFDAGETAGELLDVKKMFEESVVYCEPTRAYRGAEELRQEKAPFRATVFSGNRL